MGSILTVARREIASYFNSPVAYAFLVAFLFLADVFFFFVNPFFAADRADLFPGFFQFLPILLVIFAPAATMRLWAEEWSLGTGEILLTLPARASRLVAGKFLASWAFLGVGLALTLPLWATAAYLGEPDLGKTAAGYLGAFLVGGVYLAVGGFASSLGRHQMTAMMGAAAALFLLTFGGYDFILARLPGALRPTAAYMAASGHYLEMGRGRLSLRAAVYCASLAALFLFLTVAVLELRRRGGALLRRAGAAFIPIAAALCLACLFLAAAVNYVAAEHDAALDLTDEREHTLTDATLSTLRNLPRETTLRVFLSSSSGMPAWYMEARRRVEEVLGEYRQAAGGKLAIEICDPTLEERARRGAAAHGVRPIKVLAQEGAGTAELSIYATIVVAAGGKREVPVAALKGIADPAAGCAIDLEYDLTLAIRRVLAEKEPKIAILAPGIRVGAGDSFRAMAAGLRGSVGEPVGTGEGSPGVPEGTRVLIVLAPRDLAPQTVRAIDEYVASGGSVVLCLETMALMPPPPASGKAVPLKTGLEELFNAWGLEMEPGVIYDHGSHLRQAIPARRREASAPEGDLKLLDFPYWPEAPPEQMDQAHPITAGLARMIFPWASPIRIGPRLAGTVASVPLIRTSPRGEVKTGEVFFNPKAPVAEPYSLRSYDIAVLLTGSFPRLAPGLAPGKSAAVLLVGSSLFVSDMLAEEGVFASNLEFVRSAVEFLATGEDLTKMRRSRLSRARALTGIEDVRRRAVDAELDRMRAAPERAADPAAAWEAALAAGAKAAGRMEARIVFLNFAAAPAGLAFFVCARALWRRRRKI